MEPDLRTLTSAAAPTQVQVVAPDGCDRVAAAVVSPWRRKHPKRAETVGATLLEVLAAREVQDDQAEIDLVDEWRSRLRRLVGELRDVAPVGATRISSVRLRAEPTGHGRVYQADGNQKFVEQ